MKADIYYLGGKLGVCALSDGTLMYVAECVIDEGVVTVLPQSRRIVEGFMQMEVEITDDATSQDRVDRSMLGLQRFRDRLSEFNPDWADDAEMTRWAEQAIAARDELIGLILKLRAEKDVAW